MWARYTVVLGIVALAAAQPASAQTRADSVAMLQSLGIVLQKDSRTVVHRFVCYGPRDFCTARDGSAPDSLIRVFAEHARAELVTETAESSQPCPWGWPNPPTPPGFRIRVGQPTIRRDTARVVILRRCATADRRGFALDVEYTLVRDSVGVWRVTSERTLRITRGNARPDHAAPGAELAAATITGSVQGSHRSSTPVKCKSTGERCSPATSTARC